MSKIESKSICSTESCREGGRQEIRIGMCESRGGDFESNTSLSA